MAKEKAKKSSSKKRAKAKTASGLQWLITGLLLGLFITGLIYLKSQGTKPFGEQIKSYITPKEQ